MNSIRCNHSKAFSLFELVIVVAIIGVISVIAIPKFSDAGSGRRLSAAKKTLLADIEMTKLRARATSKVHVIKFYPANEKYVIVEGAEVTREAVILLRDFSESPFDLGILRTSLGDSGLVSITVYGDVNPSFNVGLIDDGVEVVVTIDGIEDTGLSIVDNLSAVDTVGIDVALGRAVAP